jgi:glycine dehydrogenase subunit 2
MLIFDLARSGRNSAAQAPLARAGTQSLPQRFRRIRKPALPEVSELQVVRHYTRLSQKNFCIDTHFYPLGSCTMKYNPRACNSLAMLPGFIDRHPYAPEGFSQGFMSCLYDLQEILKIITGMKGVSLTPMAGAQGEFAGVAMIRAYHDSCGDTVRREILVPDAAHGTNPATATMCGYTVRQIPTDKSGDVNLSALEAATGPHTAGIMLTNPSTLGVFERKIDDIAAIVHNAGGLLYYDGANLNAILGKVRPGDMGFDVIHMNLHKTFSTPHGGGGPGAGVIGVSARLLPFIPIPIVGRVAPLEQSQDSGNSLASIPSLGTSARQEGVTKKDAAAYRWLDERDLPQSIGRLSAFAGNVGVLLRAYVYIRMLGRQGLGRVAEFATLNANYLMARLKAEGFDAAYLNRRAAHEFIITLKRQAKTQGVTAAHYAKRLLDHGYHAPTTYFPLLVPECLLIEPTETETKEELDGFVNAMVAIRAEAELEAARVQGAPYTLPNRRFDEVRAARELNLKWQSEPD